MTDVYLCDTGAQISVIPEEMVPPAAKTGQTVQLKGYNGRVDEAEMARVSMCIGSRKWTGDVALVSGCDLNGKGILAINLRDQDSWNIINEFRGKV